MAGFRSRTGIRRVPVAAGFSPLAAPAITALVALVAAVGLLVGVGVDHVGAAVRNGAPSKNTLPDKPVPVDTGDIARFITMLAANTAGPLGIKTGKASCPTTMTAKPKAVTRFQCTVPYEGQLAPYIVTIDTSTAKFDVQPVMAILATAKLVEFVRTNVQGLTKIVCGKGKVLVRPPRSSIVCTATAGARAVEVTIRVTDNKGAITLLSAQ